MTRFPIAVLCLAAAGVAYVSARQVPTFQAGTDTVSVYTTVLDDDGHLVTDLTKDDFEIYDNGVRQDLTVFANDLQPITIVIMLDRSGSMVSNFNLVRDAAERFVENLVETDRARLGSFSNRIQLDPQTFTSDRSELVRILHENLQGPGMTPLWNATAVAMTALSREPGRRVVLMFTDGINTPDWRPTNVTFSNVRDRSQAEGVMVYAIGLSETCGASSAPLGGFGPSRYQMRMPGMGGRGRGPIGGGPPRPPGPGRGPIMGGPFNPPPVDSEGRGAGAVRRRPCFTTKPDPDLRELAGVSGGGYFELTNTDDLGATFARVAEELHQQYLLAFAPKVLDGKVHKLEVRVRRSSLTARARRNYLAATE